MANLSKKWTLADVLGIIRSELDQLAPDKIQTPQIIDILHLQLSEVAEMLNGAKFPDYGVTQVIAPVTAPTFSPVTATSYDNTTKTVTKSAHGLSAGQPLLYWDDGGKIMMGSVVSVPSSSTFTVDTAIGVTVTNFKYQAFTALSVDSVDISSYGLDTITKIKDSGVGLCTPKKIHEIDNLSEIPQTKANIFYAMFGDAVYFYKGSTVTNYGTMTMYYHRLPNKASLTTDYLDIKDKYVNVVIDKTRVALLGLLKLAVPETLSSTVNNTLMAIRAADESNKRPDSEK